MAERHQARVAKAKTHAKIGAAVTGTALAAYGAYKVNKFIRTENRRIYTAKSMDLFKRDISTDSRYKELRQQADKMIARNTLHPRLTSQKKLANSINNASNYYNNTRNYYVNQAAQYAKQDSFRTAAKNVYKDIKRNGLRR